MVISALPPESSWEKLLQALKSNTKIKPPMMFLMAQFYGTKIEPDEKCALLAQDWNRTESSKFAISKQD